MNLQEKFLWKLCKIMLKEVKKVKEGQLYPVFSPDNIQVHGTSDIRCSFSHTEPDMRKSLRTLGTTLYHLAVGESEHNTNCMLDDYQYNCTRVPEIIQPAVKTLLSGNAYSIPEIEVEISWKKRFGSALEKSRVSASVRIKKIATYWQEKWSGLGRRAEAIDHNLRRQRGSIHAVFGIMATVSLLFLAGAFINFNMSFSSLWIFAQAIIIFGAYFIFFIWRDFSEHVIRDFLQRIAVFALVAGCFFFSSFLSITAETSTTVSPPYFSVVERETGKYVASFEREGEATNPGLSYWKKPFINHFQYKIMPETVSRKQLLFKFRQPFEDGIYRLPLLITYHLKRRENILALRRWGNERDMDLALSTAVYAKSVEVQKMLLLALSQNNVNAVKTTDFIMNPEMSKKVVQDINAKIAAGVREIFSKGVDVDGIHFDLDVEVG